MDQEQKELICPLCGENITEECIEIDEEIPLEQYEKLGQG